MLWFGIGLVLLVVGFLGWYTMTYNGFIREKKFAENEWKEIDNQLQRRFDLIPNLLESVKMYAKHESDTFREVIEARNGMRKASSKQEKLEQNEVLASAVNGLIGLQESYPELKADKQFQQFNEELVSTEDKISYRRSAYNKAVMNFNTKCLSIPTNIVANFSGFRELDEIHIEEKARESLSLDFDLK